VVQKLTESKFGIPKFGNPIEIWSLMSRFKDHSHSSCGALMVGHATMGTLDGDVVACSQATRLR
jgi:hypothetical protein